MRHDMKKVIIEVGRSGGGYEKTSAKRYGRQNEDFDCFPIREKTFEKWRRYDQKAQGDKLNPLRRYLQKQVGRRWDDVYSEICEVNDVRSLVGYHLLTHLQMEVNYPGSRSQHYGYQYYFVDTDGTLQEQKRIDNWSRSARRERAKKAPVELITCEGGLTLKLEKGIWYRYQSEVYFEPVSQEYLEEENGDVVIKRTPQKMVRCVKVRKFQCGKKDLKWIRNYIKERRSI